MPSDSSVLIFASTHLLARLVGPDDIIMNFLTEMFEQAMKQAMINWTNSLASTTNNTVEGVDAFKIVHQFNHHASRPMVFQHQTSAQTGGYQYYASSPQLMACQQPLPLLSSAQAGEGYYPVQPHMIETPIYQPMVPQPSYHHQGNFQMQYTQDPCVDTNLRQHTRKR